MASDSSKLTSAQSSGWTSFLKSLASFSGDLSSLTAPAFILSPTSLTEFPAYWCEHPELFAAIADGKTPEDRAIAVLKWFICTLKGQYTTRNESMGSEKKPLNPVLGEVFYGYWPGKDGRGRTDLLVEQVSHHPPVTAFHIENKSKGVSLQGHNAQKTSFSAASMSIIVKQIGHSILTVDLPTGVKETYLITLPKLVIAGLLVGSPYIELSEKSYIASSTGYVSTISYSGKGYLTGVAHTFKAVVTQPGLSSGNSKVPALYTFEGQWDRTSINTSTKREFTDVTPTGVHGHKEEVIVAPIAEQGTFEHARFESRKLWQAVADGIRTGNYDIAAKDKARIENEQRAMRAEERTKGETWALLHFDKVESDPLYVKLITMLGNSGFPPTEECYSYKHNGPVLEGVVGN